MNVGATVLDSLSSTVTITNGGHHYQWGRNLGWAPNGSIPAANYQQGPISPAQLSTYSDKFIRTSNTVDWLNPSDDDLWGAISGDPAKVQGPCPDGWRVPTSAELGALFAKGSMKGRYCAITGDDGRIFLTPVGYHDGDCSATMVGSRGYYWSSTPHATLAGRSNFLRFTTDGGTQGITSDWRTEGYSVRAVRDIQP